MKRWKATALAVACALVIASPAAAKRCPNGKSADAAMWLSILHAGVGEWSLNDWGSFNQSVPQKKFWMGFIPVYGWPYLSIVSAIDAFNCRTDDDLNP